MERSRLLLAEDDEALASLLEEYLVEASYDVDLFLRGDEALEALRTRRYDLVLSDIVMPGADGLSLLRHVIGMRADDAELDTLVVLMTGYSGIEDALHAVEQGAYDFVSKPFQLPEIRVRLDNASRYQQLLRGWKRLNGTLPDEFCTPAASGAAVARAYGAVMSEPR